jgi:hypothetical protein
VRRPVPAWRDAWAILAFWTTCDPLAELSAELADAALQVNRPASINRANPDQWPWSMGGAPRGACIDQLPEGADILPMAPPALELLPPTPHRDDHDHSPRLESGADAPFPARWLPVRHDRTMAKLWKIDESDGKAAVFRALPWLAQSGIVRAVFRGQSPARPRQALP